MVTPVEPARHHGEPAFPAGSPAATGPATPPHTVAASGTATATRSGTPTHSRADVRAGADTALGVAPSAGPAARPRPAHRHSIRAQVLSALRAALIDGGLVPGEVYSAPVLAERFGVSATPVREAMQQLASEGAVETVPNRGFRVAEHSARDVAELAEVRALLEVPALLRLAHTLPAERWSPLWPLAEATVGPAASGDRASYAEADRAFHRALLELTGNRQLVLTAEELHRRAQSARARTQEYRTADLRSDAQQHLALLESLEHRDLVRAERLILEHFSPV